MRTSFRAVAELLRADGVIVRREHPELHRVLSHLASTGRLVALLPGVYAAPPGDAWDTRLCAAMRWDPDAVVTGRAAARAWFWPTLACLTVELALRRKARLERVGYRIVERHIPDELIFGWDGVRMTVPALTALDLCSELGGDAIDVALRTRTARLSDLWRALELTPNRRDNALRRQLLEESRDQPWSPPERRFHRLLRAAGITGWSGNITVRGDGWRYNPDVAFEIERLAAEIDGRQYHDTAVAFERDRLRQNRLVCAGWTILRFTPAMIDTDPEGVIATVQEALANIGRERASVAPARWKSRRK